MSVITLRSGKKLEVLTQHQLEPTHSKLEKLEIAKDEQLLVLTLGKAKNAIPLPFPNRVAHFKHKEEVDRDREIMETFNKVQVNIPFSETIKQILKYVKFLKELCTHKRRLKGNEKISLGKNVSALIKHNLPQKCEDLGTFIIPYSIRNARFNHAMPDLGALINVMPMSVYTSLKLKSLKEIGVVIQLANRSNAYLVGVMEDVLV